MVRIYCSQIEPLFLSLLQSASPGDSISVNVAALDEFYHNTTAFLELNAIQVIITLDIT